MVFVETPVDVLAPSTDLTLSGVAVTMWDAIRRKDAEAGHLVSSAYAPEDLVRAAATLALCMLREAGIHPSDAHLEPGDEPRLPSEPRLVTPTEACPCAVVAGIGLLAPVLARTPGSPVLAQIDDQFRLDPGREWFRLTNTSIMQVAVLVEASGLLLANRWRTGPGEPLNWCRNQVAQAGLFA